MKADILIPTGKRGGVENVVNMVIHYLEEKGWSVRVVQIVWEGDEWVETKHFYPLIRGKDGHNLEEFVDAYRTFIEDNGAPDTVLATNWPYMCYVAKKVASYLGADWRVISWIHNPVDRYKAAGFGGYPALGLADVHFAISRMIADGIRKNLPGSCVVEVRNPVKMPKCAEKLITQNRLHSGKYTLFCAARITDQKRLDIVINALARVKDTWNLRVVGAADDDYYMEWLHTLAKEKGVADCIEWLGWQENPWKYAAEADYFIMASDYEGFPLTAIESLSQGIPVISTPVSGIVQLIRPGVNGYLFPFSDDEALSEILEAVSDRKLPPIAVKSCIDSVEAYGIDNALSDFECKLREATLHPDSVMRCEGITEAP